MELNKNIEIYCDDCLNILPQIADNSVKSIIADPPYFMGLSHNGTKAVFNDLAIAKPFFKTLFEEFKRVLKDDGCVYFFTDWRTYAFYYPIIDSILGVKNMLVWDKKSGPGFYYNYNHELVIFSSLKPIVGKHLGGSIIKGIPSFPNRGKMTNGEKVHPTQKVLELIEKFVRDSTEEQDVVLDCFMGSGTTGVAALKLGRHFIGIEHDEKYFEIANKRIKEYSCNMN